MLKGVSSIKKKGVEYWYARIDGQKKYCGMGNEGRELAEIARKKHEVKQHENREIGAGIKIKRIEFNRIIDLSNWYMTLPKIQNQKGYGRKLGAVAHLMAYFGNKPVYNADPDEQERYRQHRKGQGGADGTVDIEMAVLSAMYHMALKRKKINADVMPGEFVFARSKNPRRRITDDEFESILKNADHRFQDVLICGFETAMRISEIRKLTTEQVHLDVQHISGNIVDYIDLGIFDTKTGARRTIPVSQRLKAVLKRRMEGKESEDYVFTNSTGNTYGTPLVSMLLKSACDRAGIVYGDRAVNKKGERIGVVFHCLRHTRTSKWVEMGYSDEIIRRATGHRSLQAYQQYIKLDPHAVMRLVADKNFKTDNSGIKFARSL